MAAAAAAGRPSGRSVVDDDGASHPQAGVGVGRGQDQPLRRPLGGPAQGDLLAGLTAGVPQLGPRQHSPGPPGGVDDGAGHASSRERRGGEETGIQSRFRLRREASGWNSAASSRSL